MRSTIRPGHCPFCVATKSWSRFLQTRRAPLTRPRSGVVTLSQAERNFPTTANVDAMDFRDLAYWLIVRIGPISLNVTTPHRRARTDRLRPRRACGRWTASRRRLYFHPDRRDGTPRHRTPAALTPVAGQLRDPPFGQVQEPGDDLDGLGIGRHEQGALTRKIRRGQGSADEPKRS